MNAEFGSPESLPMLSESSSWAVSSVCEEVIPVSTHKQEYKQRNLIKERIGLSDTANIVRCHVIRPTWVML